MFNTVAPKISRGIGVIGQEADVGGNTGQVIRHSSNIGSMANQISGGRLPQSPIAQKMQDVANKIENGANFVSGNEDRAQQALSTISRTCALSSLPLTKFAPFSAEWKTVLVKLCLVGRPQCLPLWDEEAP
jgi:hypothetical protein